MSNAAYRLDEADDIGKPTKPRCAAVEGGKICDRSTRHGKDLCADHIIESPYAKWIIEKLTLYNSEVARIKKSGSIKSIEEDSFVLQEIVKVLHYRGSKSIKGLAREISMEIDVVEVYARYMARRKLAKLRRAKKADDYIIDLIGAPTFTSPSFHA